MTTDGNLLMAARAIARNSRRLAERLHPSMINELANIEQQRTKAMTNFKDADAIATERVLTVMGNNPR